MDEESRPFVQNGHDEDVEMEQRSTVSFPSTSDLSDSSSRSQMETAYFESGEPNDGLDNQESLTERNCEPSESSRNVDNDAASLSWNVDFRESSSDSRSDSDGEIPEVLKKTLPVDNFSFLKEITERQLKGDNLKRNHSLSFPTKVYSSRKMVQYLKLYKSLRKHNGCVNCVSFNESGDVLISASDDRHVSLWDWSRKKNLLHFDSGHTANVFQAKFLPYSGDTQLVTCGQDHQIRISTLDACGVKNSTMIMKHTKPVHKIALQRQEANTFLSAGEDGMVYSIDIRKSKPYCTKLLVIKGQQRSNSVVPLYSIHCNPLKNFEFVVCGNDKDIRLFDQRMISLTNPTPILTFGPDSLSNSSSALSRRWYHSVTCAVFNYNGTEIVASYKDDDIYLFESNTGKEVHHYDGHRNSTTIKGVNFYGPRSEYVISGSDCGYIYIWHKNSEAIVQWLKGDNDTVNSLKPHPFLPVLATSGLDSDVKVWMSEPTVEGNSTISQRLENIGLSKEFQKVAKRNKINKNTRFSKYYLARPCIVRRIFDMNNLETMVRSDPSPIILRYRTLRAARQRPTISTRVTWSSSDEQSDSD